MKKETLILIAFILLKFLLQYLLVNPDYDLHRDEYLHLDQANHPAFGFLSVPPFTSWVGIIIGLLGNGVFWVKFFPALFGALTILVVWKATKALNGNLFALILAATCILFSALFRINFLFQPNSFDILCWTTFYYILIKYINTENAKWLYYGSVVFAIGFLNKYNILFLLIGLFPAVLLTNHRKVFARREFYYSVGLGLLLILPNVFWQYQNHFPVIHHMKELADTQLVNVDRTGFLKEQTYFFLGALPVILISLYALLFDKSSSKFRVFFWAILFTLTVFVYFKAKGYYAIGIYPIYIAFGSAFLGRQLTVGWKKFVRLIFIASPIALHFLLLDIVSIKTPSFYIDNNQKFKGLGLLRWEDGKDHQLPQDFADMLGWKELATKVDSICNTLPNNERTIILCDNYGQAGAVNYYSKNKKNKAVSFNADYIDWFNLNIKIYNFIRVKERDGSKNELEDTSPYFKTAFVGGSITNKFAREYGTTIFVFSDPKIDIGKRLELEIKEENKYRQ